MLTIRLVDRTVRICSVDKTCKETKRRERREKKSLTLLTNYTSSKQLSLLFTFGQPREAEMSIINQIFLLCASNTHAHVHTHALMWLQLGISHVFDLTWRTIFLITKEFAMMNPNKEPAPDLVNQKLSGASGCQRWDKKLLSKSVGIVNSSEHFFKIYCKIWLNVQIWFVGNISLELACISCFYHCSVVLLVLEFQSSYFSRCRISVFTFVNLIYCFLCFALLTYLT